jgi:hypothetical protein
LSSRIFSITFLPALAHSFIARCLDCDTARGDGGLKPGQMRVSDVTLSLIAARPRASDTWTQTEAQEAHNTSTRTQQVVID